MNPGLRFAIYGALFGCLFPILSTVIQLVFKSLPFSLQSIVAVQSDPMLWVIDTAPFFLGLFAWLIGRKESEVGRLIKNLENKSESDQAQIENLTTYLKNEIRESLNFQENLKEKEFRLELFASILRKISIGNNPKEIIESAIRELSIHFRKLVISYGVLAKDKRLYIQSSSEDEGHYSQSWQGISIDETEEHYLALTKGREVIVDDVETDSRFSRHRKSFKTKKIRSFMNFPLQIPESTTAVLCFDSQEPVSWLEHHIDIGRQVAAYLAVALEAAKARAQLRSTIIDLESARETAEAANKAKSIFLASMSHEIRTPMNSILGMAEVLRESPLTDDQRKYVATFYRTGKTLLNLINDIIDITRIESGQMKTDPEVFNLPQLLENTVNLFGAAATEKGVELITHMADLPEIMLEGDARRLSQVLNNLVGNAVKFTDEGRITLSARCKDIEENQACIQFRVADTGAGIRIDDQNDIFNAFFQASSKDRSKHQGSGLGLAITRSLIELMGGEIRVESEPGRGSTFEFDICFTLSGQPLEEAGPPEPGNITEIKIEVSVLLAEDNIDNRNLFLIFTKDQPLHIVVATNGREAIESYQKEEFDIVFMDMQMPEVDGYEATRKIREIEEAEKKKATPVIALTANALAEDEEKCLAAGCSDYLAKPYSKKNLIDLIAKYLPVPEETK